MLLPRDAGSNAFRRAREELSTTDGAHVHNAADGCPSPEPHDHVGAKPRRTAERLPFTHRASEEAAQNSPSGAEAASILDARHDGRRSRGRARRRDNT